MFRKTEATWKDYAARGYNSNFIFQSVDGQELPAAAQQNLSLAVNKSQRELFRGRTGSDLHAGKMWGGFLHTFLSQQAYSRTDLKGKILALRKLEITTVTDAIKKAYEEASEKGRDDL